MEGSPGKEKSYWRQSLNEICIGSVSGAAGKIVEYPFDTIKVRLQYSQSLSQPLYNSALDAITKTYRDEGMINGFYKGMKAPMVGAAMEAACLFFSYNSAQDLIKILQGKSLRDELSMGGKLICGAISGVCTSFILTPIELLKCKFQVDNLKNSNNVNKSQSITAIAKKLYKEDGIKSLFKGQTATLIRECGGSMAWFGNYEIVLHYFSINSDDPKNYKPKVYELMLAGASAGIGYNCTLFPVDTIKSIMQANDKPGLNFFEIAKQVFKRNGIRGFYSGMGVTMIKTIPTSAIMFLVYEKLKELIC
ncbi:hypothetical protein CANINC_002665 [Pichia inconspicua]|uniref:Mitochondrial ornithine carrier protein n=1 Tax=Pichia inconspicua TaxID=52247 RepID=A0A4T0X1W1_9ASCO|nr:hypothetical protein CANINC_002665 [[Candida] inconspicua]